jgi:lipoprotein-releasing system permease protein
MMKSWSSSTTLWIATKMLFSSRKKISLTGWISLFGLVLGVASLVVSMAVVSGFESTLRQSVSDVVGHLQIYRLNSDSPTSLPADGLLERIKTIEPSVQASSRFAIIEAVLAHKGKLTGVFLQGVDEAQVGKVLGLKERVKAGEFKLTPMDGVPTALIGKGIAKDFQLKPGDEFRLVVPINTDLDVSQFRRRVGTFKVAGILDLGKFEYDQRWIFTSLSSVQDLAEIGNRYSGLLLRLENPQQAREASIRLAHGLGSEYRVRDWRDVNENLFEAMRLEKVVIFFVIFVIVIAAAFNVASSLYINVVRSYPEIGILKALGVSQKKLARIFSVQGVLLGFVGCMVGVVVGILLCVGFTILENRFGILPGSVYKLDRIDVQLRFLDLLTILSATMLICFLATWAPARRAAKLTAVEGLRHE